jgi:hypothetical protein
LAKQQDRAGSGLADAVTALDMGLQAQVLAHAMAKAGAGQWDAAVMEGALAVLASDYPTLQ